MQLTIHRYDNVPLPQWTDVLTARDWKVTERSISRIKAKKHVGQSKHPVVNSTIWRVEVTTDDVTITVPAFADSPFSEDRIVSKCGTLFEVLDIPFKHEPEDLLGMLLESEEQ